VAGRIARGEVRFYTFAAPDKQRPVLILTRPAILDYLAAITIAPITSTIRGVHSEVILTEADGMKARCAVNLLNVTSVNRERIGRRITQLNAARMSEICDALRFAVGCDSVE